MRQNPREVSCFCTLSRSSHFSSTEFSSYEEWAETLKWLKPCVVVMVVVVVMCVSVCMYICVYATNSLPAKSGYLQKLKFHHFPENEIKKLKYLQPYRPKSILINWNYVMKTKCYVIPHIKKFNARENVWNVGWWENWCQVSQLFYGDRISDYKCLKHQQGCAYHEKCMLTVARMMEPEATSYLHL